MKTKNYCWIFFFSIFTCVTSNAQFLKSVIYDFDGLDINQVDLPEGDYRKGDMTTKVALNPLGQSDMLGDRVLQMNLAWNTGTGTFGRGISRYYELDPTTDRLNFYFYNPTTNPTEANVDVVITEDDDQSNSYSINSDDTWKKNVKIQKQAGWQLISLPLNSFTDSNTGGNGIFDAAFTNNKGMILMVEFRVLKNSTTNPVFYMDMISFSEGNFPTGQSILDLPAPTMPQGKCPLGAFKQKPRGSEYLIPSEVEGYFPPTPVKHLKYVNFFLQWAMDGSTTPKELPGNEVSLLLSNGYRPIITWEPMFQGYDRLASVQPRLNNIISGDYNSYIDAFADKIKSYNDTVIIRLMHEFEGNWYSWSIVYNGEDPQRYVNAYRTIVNRFRTRGATKVKWMWCLNADYAPYRYFNFAIKAYPGNDYVDIVATDVYNTHYPPELPWWMSFKYKIAETYYYLSKYVPTKPLMICELGSRERVSGESSTLQTKAQWLAKMDKELQSTFSRVKGLVFFSEYHTGDWRINSSQEALNSVTNNIWNDDYYFETTTPGSTVNCSGSGSIKREYWANVMGTTLADVPFNSAPTSTSTLYPFEGPSSAGDNYGSRIRGYLCPPANGNYIFWIASDNQSELWISTDSTPQNKIKRAYVPDYTSSRQWTKYTSQQSVPISLVAGKRYYIEAIHREGTQGDNLAVGWQLPSGTLERPLPGMRLSPFTGTASSPTTSCTASITPLSSAYFCSGGSVTLKGNAGGGLAYQWRKNGSDIAGATSQTYSANSSGDYQLKISYPGCQAWSSQLKVGITTSLSAKITPGGPTTFCNGESVILYGNTCSGYSYQWKKNGSDIPGATGNSYTAVSSGTYQLKVIQGSGAAWSSKLVITVNNCTNAEGRLAENSDSTSVQAEELKINVYPNPTTGLFTFQVCFDELEEETISYRVVNAVGNEVYNKPPRLVAGCLNENMELQSYLPGGIYILQISHNGRVESIKLLLMR
jgi:beta-mannanase